MIEPRERCAATTKKGTRCRRYALPDSPFCRQHGGRPAVSPLIAGPFADLFTPEELAAMESLDGARAIDEVLQVLLVAIRRALSNGSPSNVVVRACEAYVRASKEQQRLAAEAGDDIDEMLDGALDILSEELGIKL